MKICIFGKLRSGKSEVCNILKNQLKDATILDFGDAMKECLCIAYPQVDMNNKPRSLMISFAQHLRKLDNLIWVNALKHRIEKCESENIIVTGLRQKEGADMLKELGFKFVKISADEETRLERCRKANDDFKLEDLHNETEIIVDYLPYDFEVVNEGDFKMLSEMVKGVVEQCKNKSLT